MNKNQLVRLGEEAPFEEIQLEGDKPINHAKQALVTISVKELLGLGSVVFAPPPFAVEQQKKQ